MDNQDEKIIEDLRVENLDFLINFYSLLFIIRKNTELTDFYN